MGTRIHAYLSHDLPRFDDTAAAVARLDGARREALAVRDYWRSVDPGDKGIDRWESVELPDERYYAGPDSLLLLVRPSAALISTGGRWRGFLSIEPLRRVHLAAFRSIARAIGSPKLVLCGDQYDDAAIDAFYEKGSQDDCIAALHSDLGPPQPSIDSIAPSLVAEAEHCPPAVWFVDVLPSAK